MCPPCMVCASLPRGHGASMGLANSCRCRRDEVRAPLALPLLATFQAEEAHVAGRPHLACPGAGPLNSGGVALAGAPPRCMTWSPMGTTRMSSPCSCSGRLGDRIPRLHRPRRRRRAYRQGSMAKATGTGVCVCVCGWVRLGAQSCFGMLGPKAEFYNVAHHAELEPPKHGKLPDRSRRTTSRHAAVMRKTKFEMDKCSVERRSPTYVFS